MVGATTPSRDVLVRRAWEKRQLARENRLLATRLSRVDGPAEIQTGDPQMQSVLAMIERGWVQLRRVSHAYADAVFVHYHRRDVDRDRRPKLLGMTVRQYRESVREGRRYLATYVGD